MMICGFILLYNCKCNIFVFWLGKKTSDLRTSTHLWGTVTFHFLINQKNFNRIPDNENHHTLTWVWSSQWGTAVWPSGSWLVVPGPWVRVWGCSPSLRCLLLPWPWCSCRCASAGTGSRHPSPAERNRSSHPGAPVEMRWDKVKRKRTQVTLQTWELIQMHLHMDKSKASTFLPTLI